VILGAARGVLGGLRGAGRGSGGRWFWGRQCCETADLVVVECRLVAEGMRGARGCGDWGLGPVAWKSPFQVMVPGSQGPGGSARDEVW